jgi:branched-chain amino acid transport system ATP-binding protein
VNVLDVRGLCAGHGRTTVARDLDLHVKAGEIVGLFGPNGAGKTTTLLTVAGCLPAHGGEIEVLGEAGGRRGAQALARRGVRLVPEDRGLFRQLTVRENLVLGLPPGRGRRQAAFDEVLDGLPKLRTLLSRRAGLLSGGEQQQLALARALLGGPRLLMVDEMSMGLAPMVAAELLRILRARATAGGAGVLLVEQHVPMALQVVDRAYVLAHGRIVFSGTAAELQGSPEILASLYLGGDPGDRPEEDGQGAA